MKLVSDYMNMAAINMVNSHDNSVKELNGQQPHVSSV